MSRIDTLIAELCPDGVEYRKLGEVTIMRRGTRVVKKNLSTSEGYPVFQNSLTPLGYHTDFNEPAGTPFVICAGAPGEIGYSKSEYWAADDCYSIECSEALDSKYALHSLLRSQGTLKAQVRKASIPRLSKDVVSRLEIPVPLIEVQREVVRILDAFAALTDTLTEELDCRRQQYGYYRDRLLSRESLEALDGKPVETVRLQDLADIGTGSSNTQDQEPDGIYPFYVRSPEVKRSNSFEFEEAAIVTAGDGDVGKVFHFVEGKYALHQRTYRVKPTNSSLAAKFLYHYMKVNFRAYVEQKACSATVKSLRKPMFQNFEIPVPSLETQQKVVDILDRFDALTTSLTNGIPAEIEARRQQYEYFRDRLVDFPRKAIGTE